MILKYCNIGSGKLCCVEKDSCVKRRKVMRFKVNMLDNERKRIS